MQEEVTEKTIALSVRAGRMTVTVLRAALRKFLAETKKARNNPKVYRGRQSVKKLVRQGAGVSNVEITDSNIKSFERVAKKYGIDFALKKDASVTPSKWLVFFKGRDADALNAAFKEFTAKTVSKSKGKPSLLAQLKKFKELVKNNVIDKVKHRQKEQQL
jgi:seryl-tRNA(Sec) selenium transferase